MASPPATALNDFCYMPDGRMVFSTPAGAFYLSADKGLHWTKVKAEEPGLALRYYYSGTLNNGDSYFTRQPSTSKDQYYPIFFKIVKGANTPVPVLINNLPLPSISISYIDDHNNIYLTGSSSSGYGEIYRSSDFATWTRVFSASSSTQLSNDVIKFTKHSDGYYYFLTQEAGLFKTTDFTSTSSINKGFPIYSGESIVANNNYYIVNSFPNSIWYYVP